MKPLVYVAGPIAIPEPMENTHRAVKAATVLLDSGVVAPIVPHLTCLWHIITPRDYSVWMAYDFELLARCDALIRLAGQSAGADLEVERAEELGLPVFRDLDEVIAWAVAQ